MKCGFGVYGKVGKSAEDEAGYEEQMKKVSDKYTIECFEQYFEELVFGGKEWYTGISQNNGYKEKIWMNIFITILMRMELYFNREWEGIPAEYLLDANLTTEVELRISIPLEEISF